MSLLSRFLCALRSYARKWTPALFFLLVGATLLFGQDALLVLTHYVHGAPDPVELSKATYTLAALGDPHSKALVSAAENMSGAEVAADAQASGWLPFGLLTSKLLTATGAFCLACIIVWRMQRLVLPAPSAWARKGYSYAFDSLTDREKFVIYQAGRWQLIVLAVAALMFAALVQ